jgi:hypothetical protein
MIGKNWHSPGFGGIYLTCWGKRGLPKTEKRGFTGVL